SLDEVGQYSALFQSISDAEIVLDEHFLCTQQGMDDVAQVLPLGARPVEVRVKNAEGDPVPAAMVSVWDTLFSTRFALGQADAIGVFRLLLNDGDYILLAESHVAALSPAEASLTVDGPEIVNIVLATFAGKPPVLPGFCRIFSYVYDLTGKPLRNAVFHVVRNVPTELAAGAVIGEILRTTTTNHQGMFWIDMLQGVTVTLRAPNGDYAKTFVVPEQDAYNPYKAV
ncbi:MAG: hypothetical protein KC496_23155, partial [Anaerolineae bacterium]|nr:hypothetical protein [Anaerolineae bacterium]